MLRQFTTPSSINGRPPASARSEAALSIERILKARRDRSKHLPAELFCDPAWDILLFLTMADMERREVSVSEVCDQADAPYSTALCYIDALERNGLAERRDDWFDRRRKYLSLTDRGRSSMWNYLVNTPHTELRAA